MTNTHQLSKQTKLMETAWLGQAGPGSALLLSLKPNFSGKLALAEATATSRSSPARRVILVTSESRGSKAGCRVRCEVTRMYVYNDYCDMKIVGGSIWWFLDRGEELSIHSITISIDQQFKFLWLLQHQRKYQHGQY